MHNVRDERCPWAWTGRPPAGEPASGGRACAADVCAAWTERRISGSSKGFIIGLYYKCVKYQYMICVGRCAARSSKALVGTDSRRFVSDKCREWDGRVKVRTMFSGYNRRGKNEHKMCRVVICKRYVVRCQRMRICFGRTVRCQRMRICFGLILK